MEPLIPRKLQPGDTVRVLAPAVSLPYIGEDTRAIADRRLRGLGLRVSFGRHVNERDRLDSTTVEARVADLHDAFADSSVHGILTVIGGYNSNGLLPHLDWELIRAHPKPLCGYSDITALQNAMLARAGLVTYSGPHYSTFGQKLHNEYTVEGFVRCLMAGGPFPVRPSRAWSDDPWYLDQDARTLIPNPGYTLLSAGSAEGRIVGGNLCTLNLLQGTPFMPDLAGTILFIEDDEESHPAAFDRDLQSLLQVPSARGVRGLVIGRFQRASGVTDELLRDIVSGMPQLRDLPVIAGADFGHTFPMFTFPIGGTARIAAGAAGAQIEILRH